MIRIWNILTTIEFTILLTIDYVSNFADNKTWRSGWIFKQCFRSLFSSVKKEYVKLLVRHELWRLLNKSHNINIQLCFWSRSHNMHWPQPRSLYQNCIILSTTLFSYFTYLNRHLQSASPSSYYMKIDQLLQQLCSNTLLIAKQKSSSITYFHTITWTNPSNHDTIQII
jgi:hypothetical protein